MQATLSLGASQVTTGLWCMEFWHWITNPGVQVLEPVGGFMADSAF